jgi:Ran GTPase-activating protein (RanGAP) involved in mRNA processing and transport
MAHCPHFLEIFTKICFINFQDKDEEEEEEEDEEDEDDDEDHPHPGPGDKKNPAECQQQ